MCDVCMSLSVSLCVSVCRSEGNFVESPTFTSVLYQLNHLATLKFLALKFGLGSVVFK